MFHFFTARTAKGKPIMPATNKKLRPLEVLIAAVVTTGSAEAASVSVGAYAVANHSSCGAGNIPGTIEEMNRFFASPDLPADMQKNFYWKDARVRQNEWIKDGDNKASSEASNGFDGADASLLTYIASHGVTSSGVYKALAGSKNAGGCYIPTTSLELGNNTSRYTILSTCQGLKIGTGDYPESSGENPTRTWKNAAKGLNCIFGYSNNMADADQYGEYLLANLKDGSTSLSKAFMDASESVSADNIPAVLCYGSSEQDAADYIEENKTFESQSRPNAASAWVYRKVYAASKGPSLKSSIPAALKLVPVKLNIEKFAKSLVGGGATKSVSGRITTFSSNTGVATYNEKTGTLTVKNFLAADARGDAVPSLEESQQIAEHALKLTGLSKVDRSLQLASFAEERIGGVQGAGKITSRKFTFKQNLAGGQSLSQQGSVDVTVGSGGAITEIKTALVKIDPAFTPSSRPTNLASREVELETSALDQVAMRAPGASYKVIKKRIGYDAGNFMKRNQIAPAVIEFTVEAYKGDFKRNFVQKIAL
jgi:hypothetical protein